MDEPRRLIIGADDFGRDQQVNEAVKKAYEANAITTASLLPNGVKFANAVDIAETLDIPVGIHLNLLFLEPVLEPSDVPSLVTEQGQLFEGYEIFLRKYLLGSIDGTDLEQELRAQFEKIKKTGLRVTHIDSHQHVHLFPGLFQRVTDLAEEYDIESVRTADEILTFGNVKQWSIPLLGLKLLSKSARYFGRRRGFSTNDWFTGVLHRDALSTDDLRGFFNKIPSGVTEFGVHISTENYGGDHWARKNRPRDDFDRAGTLELLLSDEFQQARRDNNITLIDYGTLGSAS